MECEKVQCDIERQRGQRSAEGMIHKVAQCCRVAGNESHRGAE